MHKIQPKEIALLAFPTLALAAFGLLVSGARTGISRPSLEVKVLSVAQRNEDFPKRGEREVKMRVKYNPQTWLEARRSPDFSALDFQLIDDTGKMYGGVTRGFKINPTAEKGEYDIRYHFLVAQLANQMPPAATQVHLFSKIKGLNGKNAYGETTVFRRK